MRGPHALDGTAWPGLWQMGELLETLPIGFYLKDREGRYIQANTRYARSIGMTRTELLGRTDLDIRPGEPAEEAQRTHERVVRTGVTTPTGEERFLEGGKQRTTVTWRVPLRGPDGSVAAVVGLGFDITELKEVEEALRERGGRLRLLEENVVDVIWTMGTDLRLTYITPSVTRFSGFAPEEVLASSLEELLTPTSVENVMAALEEELRSEGGGLADRGRTRTVDLEHWRKDGSTVWAETSISFLRDDTGGLVGFLGVTRDITERKRAQLALRESEEKFRLLAENIADVIWTADSDLRFTFFSPSVKNLLGYEPEEATSLPFTVLLTPASVAVAREAIARALQPASIARPGLTQIITVELEHVRKDGSSVWTELTASLLRDASGRLMGFQGVTRDISARKQVEEALKRSERELQVRNRVAEILLSAPDDQMYGEVLSYLLETFECRFGVLGPVDDGATWSCPAVVWGSTMASGQRGGRLVLPRLLWTGMWGEALSTGSPRLSNAPVRIPGGEHNVLRAMALPLVHHGKVVGGLMVGQRDSDFTDVDASLLVAVSTKLAPVLHAKHEKDRLEADRRMAEGQLRVSEARYRDLFESASDLIHIADPQGRLLYVNRAWRRTMGYSEDELKGLVLSDLVHPDNVPVFEEALERARSGEDPRPIESVLVARDGREVDVVGTLSCHMEGGRPTSLRGIFMDITDRKRAERDSGEARRKAELYVDLLSHDINNMNMAISAYMELALRGGSPPGADKRYLESTLGQSLAISNLISKVRKLSDLEQGAIPIIDMDVHAVVSEAAARVTQTHPERRVRVENPRPAFDVRARGNELLHDVFFNLLDNAVKYDRHDEVVIEVSYSGSETGEFLIVEVKDRGPGVPDRLKENIFNRLERGDEKQVHGAGLGLTIVSEVVGRCGGSVWIEDRIKGVAGQGASFVVLLVRGAAGPGPSGPG